MVILYISNLGSQTCLDTLRALVAPFGGDLDVGFLTDPLTDRPRGIARVRAKSPEQARQIAESLRGVEVDGRRLVFEIGSDQSNDARSPDVAEPAPPEASEGAAA